MTNIRHVPNIRDESSSLGKMESKYSRTTWSCSLAQLAVHLVVWLGSNPHHSTRLHFRHQRCSSSLQVFVWLSSRFPIPMRKSILPARFQSSRLVSRLSRKNPNFNNERLITCCGSLFAVDGMIWNISPRGTGTSHFKYERKWEGK